MSLEEPVWVDEVKLSNYDLYELPDTIEQEIFEYLAIEFAPDFEAVLTFSGEFELWGKPIMCWDFGSDEVFATVQPYSTGYYIAVTDKAVANAQGT